MMQYLHVLWHVENYMRLELVYEMYQYLRLECDCVYELGLYVGKNASQSRRYNDGIVLCMHVIDRAIYAVWIN